MMTEKREWRRNISQESEVSTDKEETPQRRAMPLPSPSRRLLMKMLFENDAMPREAKRRAALPLRTCSRVVFRATVHAPSHPMPH